MRFAAGTLDRYVFILLRGRCEIRDREIAATQNKGETKAAGEGNYFAWVMQKMITSVFGLGIINQARQYLIDAAKVESSSHGINYNQLYRLE